MEYFPAKWTSSYIPPFKQALKQGAVLFSSVGRLLELLALNVLRNTAETVRSVHYRDVQESNRLEENAGSR